MRESDHDVTQLLDRWQAGDRRALSELMPLVYQQLHRLAARAMYSEREDHTLQATALVHEVFLRLDGGTTPSWRDRAHFYAVAARLMRHILVDHARAMRAARRGGGMPKVPLDDKLTHNASPPVDLIALDQALSMLATHRPRQVQVVELRFFGGLSVEEAASVLDVSVQTVVLDTRLARAWLFDHLRRSAA